MVRSGRGVHGPGVTYAIWAEAGMALVSIVGWAVFRQPLSAAQLIFMALIIGGSVGLILSTTRSSGNL
jgi:multidrug transporter EmrE-like cation transporter